MRVSRIIKHGADEAEGTVLTKDWRRRGDIVGFEEAAGAGDGHLELFTHLASIVGEAGGDGLAPPGTFVVDGGGWVGAAGGDVGVRGRVTLDEDIEGLAEELRVALAGTIGGVEGCHSFVAEVGVIGLDGRVGVEEDEGVVWGWVAGSADFSLRKNRHEQDLVREGRLRSVLTAMAGLV